jgi:hypothetical protein
MFVIDSTKCDRINHRAWEFCHRQVASPSEMLAGMSKTLLYTLAAIADIIFAIIAWRSGRIMIPIVLVFACLCFVVAAIGSAMGKGGPKSPT